MRSIGNATIEKVEELCAAGFRPSRMFPKFCPAPAGFHPSMTPRQSTSTSWKPSFVLTRVRARFVVGYVGSVKNT